MFTFNGVHANTHGLKVVTVDRSPLPAIENTMLEVPNINGAYFIKNKLKTRTIEMDVNIVGTSEADLRTKVRNIGAWLYSKQPAELLFDDENSMQYKAVVDATSLQEVLKVGEGTLKFICPQPYAEALTETSVTLTSNANKAITVGGNTETFGTVTVTFTGATTNFTVTHVATGKKVAITQVFKATDVLVIDFTKGYVTLNGTNAMPTVSLDSDFFALPTGAGNIHCTTYAGTATLKYKNRWL